MIDENNLLLSGILKDAEKEAEKLIADAHLTADKIILEAEDKAERDRQNEKALFDIKMRSLALQKESDKEAFDRVLELKRLDASYDKVLSLVEKRWEEVIKDASFSSVLTKWIAEGAIGLNLPEAKVSFSKKAPVTDKMLRDAEKLVLEATNLKVKLSLDEVYAKEVGVVVSSLDDKISYNNLISTRSRRFKKQIKDIVQEITCKVEE